MRRTGPWVLVVSIAAWTLCLVAPALAKDPLLAGGGGGMCYAAPPQLDTGWVAVGDNCFSPRVAEVGTGGAIRWSLEGKAPHSVTFDGGPAADTLTGDGFAVQFNEPGTYEYSCTLHPGMVGTVRAVGDTLSGPALEVLGLPAMTTSGDNGAMRSATELRDSVATRVEFSPLAAVVVLAVGLPLSLGLALRLVGFSRVPAGYRLRLPWESRRAPRPPARR
jgi:hypothetical protein